ncbi:hypothetical protein N9Y74_02065 [Alphaproteobacteria bacterium]|nr:hypothetical protein [Alphaproteobacteria bacterium]
MNSFGKLMAGVIGGSLIAFLVYMITNVAASGFDNTREPNLIIFGLAWVVSIVIAILSPRPAKAWRRMFIILALVSFTMPLASMVFAVGGVSQTDSGAEVAGAAIAGGLMSIISGVFSFFMGGLSLIIGLLIGRDPKVVVVHSTDDISSD